MKKRRDPMKKSLLFLLLLLALGSFSDANGVIKEGEAYPLDKFQEKNKKIIKMVVKEISKTLPQKVDEYTKIVNIHDEGLTLIYTFEINTGAKSDRAIIKEDKARMKKNITRGICQSSKHFLDAGVTLSYKYLSASTKRELFTFTMTKKICGELNK